MKSAVWWTFILISLCAYFYLGYQLDRTNFNALLLAYGIPFATYFWLIAKPQKLPKLSQILSAGIVLRLVFLFSVPLLSDDYFRFLWDGQLLAQGFNPFDFKPADFEGELPLKESLLEGMNSPDYYSIYPPLSQFVYAFSAWLFPNSILASLVTMRLFILFAEMGTLLLLPKLLKQFSMPVNKVAIYALNPLVIVELSGNLHFEALVIFFLLLAFYFLQNSRFSAAAMSWSMAAATKLIPLIFLPVLVRKYPFKKWFPIYLLGGFCFLIMWIPFYSVDFISNFKNSLDLYFSSFEFNAGIYYLVREVWAEKIGYNPIQTLGPILSKIALLAVLWILLRRSFENLREIFPALLFALTAYYALALIVHPWYISMLVFLAVFSRYVYPLLWSALIVLSYAAYQTAAYQENYYLVFLEYGLVFGLLIYELWFYRSHKKPFISGS